MINSKKITYSSILIALIAVFLLTNPRAALLETQVSQGAYYRGEYLFTTYYPSPYGAFQELAVAANVNNTGLKFVGVNNPTIKDWTFNRSDSTSYFYLRNPFEHRVLSFSPQNKSFEDGGDLEAVFIGAGLDYDSDPDPAKERHSFMSILNNGNVGIGTANPKSKLHVNIPDYYGIATPSDILTANNALSQAGVRFEASRDPNFPGQFLYGDHGPDNYFWMQIGKQDKGNIKGYGPDYLITEGYSLAINPLGGNVGIGTTNPNQLLVVGSARKTYCNGTSWGTDGSDYAEYFKNEESIEESSLVGINTATGKVRKYRKGDEFVGIVSVEPGFVGNANKGPHNDKNYTLVGLLGQLKFNKDEVDIVNGLVYTKDKKKIGVLLNNGKVFLR